MLLSGFADILHVATTQGKTKFEINTILFYISPENPVKCKGLNNINTAGGLGQVDTEYSHSLIEHSKYVPNHENIDLLCDVCSH